MEKGLALVPRHVEPNRQPSELKRRIGRRTAGRRWEIGKIVSGSHATKQEERERPGEGTRGFNIFQ